MSITNNRILTTTSVRGLRHDLPPMRLWQKAKKLGVWNPIDIDLVQRILNKPIPKAYRAYPKVAHPELRRD